ncbi:hypothetical protein ABW21_db0207148 [Orbilia brochopaga]|nr:hypothetical protein ABW21_db0207148 [Drechslerella brochopaga]
MDLLRREWIQPDLLDGLQELTKQMRVTRKDKERSTQIWIEALTYELKKEIRTMKYGIRNDPDGRKRLVRAADWSPPRYIELQLPESESHYVQIIQLISKSVQPGRPFKAVVGDGYTSISAIFKLDPPGALENPHLIKNGALIQVIKFKFRFPRSCQNSLQDGITREDQRRAVRLKGRGGTHWSHGSKAPYSNAIAICAYRDGRDMTTSTEPELQIEKFVVLGGDDHNYGESKPVSGNPDVKTAIANFPVLPISVPLPDQWSSNIVQRIVDIWYTEIAWYKFIRTLSPLTPENTRFLAKIKDTFKQKLRRDNRAIANVVRAAKREFLEPLYNEQRPIVELYDIRRVYIELQSILERRQAIPWTDTNYIPGLRLQYPRTLTSQPPHRWSIFNPFSSQQDMLGTQPFATQVPVPRPIAAALGSAIADDNIDLEKRITSFRFGEVSEAERSNFCIIMQTLYESVKANELRTKEALTISDHKRPDVEAITDHITDFYAALLLRKIEILEDISGISTPPKTPQQHESDDDVSMDDVSANENTGEKQLSIDEKPPQSTSRVILKRPRDLRSKEDIDRVLSGKKPRLTADIATRVDTKLPEPTPSATRAKPSRVQEPVVQVQSTAARARRDVPLVPAQRNLDPPNDQPSRSTPALPARKRHQRISSLTTASTVKKSDNGEENNGRKRTPQSRDSEREQSTVTLRDDEARTISSTYTREEEQKPRQPIARKRGRKSGADKIIAASDDEGDLASKYRTGGKIEQPQVSSREHRTHQGFCIATSSED